MWRGKIEREPKRGKKKRFLLGRNERGRREHGLPPSRRHKESMCKSKERGSRTRKKKKRGQPRGSCLKIKKTAKRELCV